MTNKWLGTLSKRSHWTIRTAILFHQNISRKVWSIIAAAASLWWSVRHTEIYKWPKVFKFKKCSSAPSCELAGFKANSEIITNFRIFEKKIFEIFFLIFLGYILGARSDRSSLDSLEIPWSIRYTVKNEFWNIHEFHFSFWHFTRRYDIVDFY